MNYFKLSKTAIAVLLAIGLSQSEISMAQSNNASQIVAPVTGELLRSANFGRNTVFKNNMLFVMDPQYRTDERGKWCNIGHGALYVYKKNSSGLYDRVQKLKHLGGVNSSGVESAEVFSVTGQTNTTLKFNNAENGYGESGIDAAGNLLVVAAPREDYNRLGPNRHNLAGAVYLYRRASSTSNFSLVKMIYDNNPSSQTRFAGGGVSTNGEYIAALTQENNTMKLFRLSENNVNLVNTLTFPSSWINPYIHGTTDNNMIVLTATVNTVNRLFLYKISNQTFVQYDPSNSVNLIGYELQNDKVFVNGNSFVIKYKNLSTGENRLKVFQTNANGFVFSQDVIIPSEVENLDITGVSAWEGIASDPNSKRLAVTFKKQFDPLVTPVIYYFKYFENLGVFEYRTKMTLPSQYSGNSSYAYGNRLLLTNNELIISDDANKTFDSTNDGIYQQCSEYKASGVVFVHSKTNFENGGLGGFKMENSTAESEATEYLAPNPVQGSFVDFETNSEIISITATNTNGVTYHLNFKGKTINISSLESGLYILKIETNSGAKVKKLSVL